MYTSLILLAAGASLFLLYKLSTKVGEWLFNFTVKPYTAKSYTSPPINPIYKDYLDVLNRNKELEESNKLNEQRINHLTGKLEATKELDSRVVELLEKRKIKWFGNVRLPHVTPDATLSNSVKFNCIECKNNFTYGIDQKAKNYPRPYRCYECYKELLSSVDNDNDRVEKVLRRAFDGLTIKK